MVNVPLVKPTGTHNSSGQRADFVGDDVSADRAVGGCGRGEGWAAANIARREGLAVGQSVVSNGEDWIGRAVKPRRRCRR